MRDNFEPILNQFGVDVVFAGESFGPREALGSHLYIASVLLRLLWTRTV